MTVKDFFRKLGQNILVIYSPRNLVIQLLAFILTYLVVISDFDWRYYRYFRTTFLYKASFSSAIVGGLLPIVLPFVLLIGGAIKKNYKLKLSGVVLGQAALLGWLISSIYKAFTGRDYPPPILNSDISKIFHFGLWKQGIFWGWPSSHTTVAFAMSFSLIMLFRNNKLVRYLALIYALWIGFGVSLSIHWFSDFAAGAIIGTIIGLAVGRSFSKEYLPSQN